MSTHLVLYNKNNKIRKEVFIVEFRDEENSTFVFKHTFFFFFFFFLQSDFILQEKTSPPAGH